MSSSKQCRHFEGADKVAILKRHLIDKVPISDLSDELDIQPTQLYDWIKKFFENGHLAFGGDRKSKAAEDAKDRKIEQLEAKMTRKNEVMAELMEEHTQLKKILGDLKGRWVGHDTRDSIVDFVRDWSDKTEIPARRFMPWLGIGSSKFHDWKQRFGKVNEHNAWVPRDHWLADDEKEQEFEPQRH